MFKHKNTLRYNILQKEADVITIGEANVPKVNHDLAKEYPDFNHELLFMPGHAKARLAVFVRKGIIYERLRHLEMDDICMLVLRI